MINNLESISLRMNRVPKQDTLPNLYFTKWRPFWIFGKNTKLSVSDSLWEYVALKVWLSKKNVLLGVTNTPHEDLINNIINICKRYIYNTKFFACKLNVHEAIAMIKDIFKLEQDIVRRNCLGFDKLQRKWKPIREMFCSW